jgi:hypothetical protein
MKSVLVVLGIVALLVGTFTDDPVSGTSRLVSLICFGWVFILIVRSGGKKIRKDHIR